DHIQKILINLISNALKFTHAGGKVEITVQNKDKAGITIIVSDTGEGIPEKDLPHIFERYYQAAHPKQLNQGGTGIGLALSLELARLHGGNLTAGSQLGKGSSFSLSLPESLVNSIRKTKAAPTVITHPALSDTTTVSPFETITGPQNKPLILLVEDNTDMRQYIRGFMDGTYRIAEAADGLEALKFLKENSPDLIISDIMMPRMDGITLAKMLKKDEILKNIPFITLTARAGESDKIATLRIGIDDYLSKPFNAEELEARAANLIRNYRE
ncbi:MAG: response regulator, partial [Sinomicrobium sp.]|nr:response regulator [Sinomicrobium sp.]